VGAQVNSRRTNMLGWITTAVASAVGVCLVVSSFV
jgi:hypothetical protein